MCACLAAAILLAIPVAAATEYTVDSSPFTVSHTVLESDSNEYKLTAGNGQRVSYSMTVTTTGACSSLYFIKGHTVGAEFQYLRFYSENACRQSYSNEFPVDSDDGTQFTILIQSTYAGDVTYTLTINVFTPAIPSWVLGLVAFVILGVVGVVIRTALRRRRRRKMAAAMPPMPPLPPPAAPPP